MPENKFKPSEEWFAQADYDLGSAEAMFNSGRYIYTIFMCHLSIEKILKGLFAKKFEKDPPKIHDLIYLLKKIELELPCRHQDFLKTLNEVSVPTRYPDELEKLLKEYRQEEAQKLLNQTKELLLWLKGKL